MIKNFMVFTNKFDTITEQVISEDMCSEKCPCLDYVFDDGTIESSSKGQFDIVMESHLNKYGRTKNTSHSAGYKPLVWTTDETKGFKSLADCYKAHPLLQKNAAARTGNHQQGEEVEGENRVESSTYYYYAQMQIYEDRYNCSGMCHTSLFYYSSPLQYGPPKETCLTKFLHNIDGNAHPFAVLQILTGTLSLILFLGHFGLYNRPLPNSLNDRRDPNLRNQLAWHIGFAHAKGGSMGNTSNQSFNQYGSDKLPQDSFEPSLDDNRFDGGDGEGHMVEMPTNIVKMASPSKHQRLSLITPRDEVEDKEKDEVEHF